MIYSSDPLGNMDKVLCLDLTMKARYDFQKARTHVPTKWYSRYDAAKLGMHEDVKEAFDNIGAGSLLSMDLPSYPALTSEFLMSIQTIVDKPSNSECYIRFRLGNEKRTMSLKNMNEIFGIPNPTDDYKPSWIVVERTWCLLTGQKMLPTTSLRSRDIASPLFRIILCILGNTIWARRENSRPTEREIGCIHGMLFAPKVNMNLGFEFLKHVLSCKKDGEVWFGGMITKIAMSFDIDLSRYNLVDASYINRDYLLRTKVLEFHKGMFLSSFIGVNSALEHAMPLKPRNLDLMFTPNWYEVWACEPLPLKGPDFDLTRDKSLRRREPRVYPNDAPNDWQEGGEVEEMVIEQEGEDYGFGPGIASGSGAPTDHYLDLSAKVAILKANIDEVRASIDGIGEDVSEMWGSIDEVKASLEAKDRKDGERWQQIQDFMEWMREQKDWHQIQNFMEWMREQKGPSRPGPSGTTPHHA